MSQTIMITTKNASLNKSMSSQYTKKPEYKCKSIQKQKFLQNPQEGDVSVKVVLRRNHENMFSSHDPLKQTGTESTEAWQS